jgi:uncharacterized protein YjdB
MSKYNINTRRFNALSIKTGFFILFTIIQMNAFSQWNTIFYDDFESGMGHWDVHTSGGRSSDAERAHQGQYSMQVRAYWTSPSSYISGYATSDNFNGSAYDHIKVTFWAYTNMNAPDVDGYTVYLYNNNDDYVSKGLRYETHFQNGHHYFSKTFHNSGDFSFTKGMEIKVKDRNYETIYYDEITISYKIDVSSISIIQENLTLLTNQTSQLTTSILPSNATDKTKIWSTSDPSIVTVDANGVVTAVSFGIADIIATSNDGGHSDFCTVTVFDQTEYNALCSIYNTTNGDSWSNTWNLTNQDLPLWYGLSLTNNKVSQISLPNNNLNGDIPAEITDLTELNTLDLSSNNIIALPDLTSVPVLSGNLDVSNNNLNFSHIEPNITLFSNPAHYSNQDNFDLSPANVTINAGEIQDYVVNFVGGNNNRYRWKRDGEYMTQSSFHNTMSFDDIGTYECEVTNVAVEQLTITNNPVHIDVNYTMGDVNNNGKILAFDAALVLMESTGLNTEFWGMPNPWKKWQFAAGNACLDDPLGVTAMDAAFLLQYIVGKVPQIPYTLKKGPAWKETVTVTLEDDTLVFRSGGNLYGFSIEYKTRFEEYIPGKPVNCSSDMLMSWNLDKNVYRLGMATAYPPAANKPFLKIPTMNPQENVAFTMRVNGRQIIMNMQNMLCSAESANPVQHIFLSCYPNPSKGKVTFVYTLQQPTYASLQIFDIHGKLHTTLLSGICPAGQNSISWSPKLHSSNRFKPGIYIVRFRTNNSILTKNIIIQ